MSATPFSFPTPPSTMREDEFVERFGGIYEHSPWVARETWQQGLNTDHDTVDGLSAAMATTLAAASRERKLALVRAHPDLAGKAAVSGELTADSTSEQAAAGIDQCTPEEFERFEHFNDAYKEKFGFPFVMAVRGSDRHQILAAFEQRLENDQDAELERALMEINKIAQLRLEAQAKTSNG